jgi:hypothetical protein
MDPMKNCQSCTAKDPAADVLTGKSKKQYFHYSTPITTLSASQATQISIPIFSDSYFVIKKLTAVSTGTFTTQILNGSTGRVLMNAPINNANLFGTVQLPNRLADPLVLPPSSNIVLSLTDTSASSNTIQITLNGYRDFNLQNPPIPTRGGALLSWYQNALNFSFAGNDTLNQILRIDADAAFLVRKIVGNGATGSPISYAVRISDSGGSEYWFDNEQADVNTVGTAQYPNLLARPRLVPANSSVNFELRDLTGSTNNVQIILEGAKVYR